MPQIPERTQRWLKYEVDLKRYHRLMEMDPDARPEPVEVPMVWPIREERITLNCQSRFIWSDGAVEILNDEDMIHLSK